MENIIDSITSKVTVVLANRLTRSGCSLEYNDDNKGIAFKDIAGVKWKSTEEIHHLCEEASKQVVNRIFLFLKENKMNNCKKLFYNIHVTKLERCDQLYYVRCIFSK